MKTFSTALVFASIITFVSAALAQTPPPPPTLSEPPSGASLVQPISLAWNPMVDPDGPIGSYTWQVASSSTFSTIIAQGSQNMLSDEILPATRDRLSGLPNGTYFWRVSGIQMVGGTVGSIESGWSQVRTFTITGLGPAPGRPTFTSPANLSAFHPLEFFDITWSAVPGAHYYLLEADDEPTFSHPLTLTTDLIQFGTKFNAGWGNVIPNVYYRVRAVSSDNVRGLPSPVLNLRIVNSAPVPGAPAPLSPVGGAVVSLPTVFDWSDTPNPQIGGYDLDIDDEPNFEGTIGVVLVQQISRSDYMLSEEPGFQLAPGTYFWRVRAVHGNTFGPWSSGASFKVVAPAPTPPGEELFWIIAEPGSVSGGNPTQARVTLNQPAGPGGATIKIASDLPHVQVPGSVLIPEGKTDAWVSPVSTVPVSGATIGRMRASYARDWQQSSIGLWQILWGISLSAESVVGGESLVGNITLLNPAPPGGVEVTLVSSDTQLLSLPPKISIPAGEFGATFQITTAPVSIPTRVVINSGTAFEGYRAPENWLMLRPAGSSAPASSLAALSLADSRLVGGMGTTTGTVTLTGPAPSGGAVVRLFGSMEGEVIVPQNVTVPEGSISANFTITAPQVNAPRYVLIQASYGVSGGMHAKLIGIAPGLPGEPTLLAMAVKPFQGIGGETFRGTVGLVMPAPTGGATVNLSSDNPAAQVPATVSIAPGNSANSFEITTSPVLLSTPVRIEASAGGISKTFFIYLGPDPNAPPLLQSLAVNPSSVSGGNSVTGTIFLSAPAPAGGITVTLATSTFLARAPGVVNVLEGQTSATFTITTSAVSSSTPVTVTAFFGSATRAASFTITTGSSQPPAPGSPSLLSPADGSTVPQPVALDWSDASNAASYEIQVDDSSTFSTPLVRSLTYTASQATVSDLAPIQHWWRVRARNSAGVAGNWSTSRRFTPQGTPAPAALSSVTVNPGTVVGGSSSDGRVTLTSAAPAGGVVVNLSSSSPSASLPASVTIPAGGTSANFTVTTMAVASDTNVEINAVYNSITRTAVLRVTTQSAGPLPAPALVSPSNDARFRPGQTIRFDWNDVTGAASYTIQIADSSSFSAPQRVNETLTSSDFSSATLPTRRMWWRARANAADGTPGAWSSSRRFEVKK